MFKSRFIKPISVQPFKPRLMNVALEYIRKKKKKYANGSEVAFLKTRLQPYP